MLAKKILIRYLISHMELRADKARRKMLLVWWGKETSRKKREQIKIEANSTKNQKEYQREETRVRGQEKCQDIRAKTRKDDYLRT